MTGAELGTWVAGDDTVWYGADVPATATGTTDCELDPADWGPDPAADFAASGFGVGVGELSADTISWMDQVGFTDEEKNENVGGVMRVSSFIGEDSTSVYTFGSEVDADFNIDTNNIVPLSAAVMDAQPGIATGYYSVNMSAGRVGSPCRKPAPADWQLTSVSRF